MRSKRFLKRLTCLLIVLCVSLSAGAVLKEKNLKSTLSVLRAELETSFNEQRQNMARYNAYAEAQHKMMVQMMQRSDQVALMLYSQKQDFTFDMTYACHEATEMYREFNTRRMPFDRIMKRMRSEINRYEYLIETLSAIPPSMKRMQEHKHNNGKGKMPAQFIVDKNGKQRKLPFLLDEQGLHDRKACLDYATALSRNLQNMCNSVEKDAQHYKRISAKLKKMNDYAIQRYNDIQHNIFINGDQNYAEILKNMPMQYHNAKADVNEKYEEEKVKSADGGERKIYSQWRGPIVTGISLFVIFYLIIAGMLSNVFVRWLVPKRFRTEEFMKKKVCLMLFGSMLIFAVALMIARTFMYHNFFLMASKLLIEFAWLLCAIFFSLLVRLPGDQIKSGFKIYTPIILMSFIVITFRIIFIPNNLVMLIFPPILILFTLWQWAVVKRHNDNIPRSDIFYTWISLAIMAFSACSAVYGYVLLSVQVLIWWMFQLSCIQTITCVYDMLAQYEKRYLSHKIHSEDDAAKAKKGSILSIITLSHEKHINVTWFYDFVYMALVPMISVFSVMISIWWAADVFDLTATVWKVFMFNFLNVPDVVQLSIGKLVMVLALFFQFRYINYLIKSLYHKYHRSKVVVNGKPNFTLANNVIAILCWGLYFIFSIKLLKIPSTAISVISAGLATGVGFAMKDLLENFFYGISLMTGRVRVGDFIECDGIRGKVDSITYQSTQIITGDGCVIAFLNSSLFSKNFKNITKNHSYEWVKVPVGVAYGSNIEDVRQMLVNAVKSQEEKAADGRDIIDTTRPVSVVFDDFGDNSVNLFVTYWVLVEQKFAKTGQVKEAIYNTLNENHIEIPFPQRDLHIING